MKRIISAGLCTAFILSLAGCARQDTTPSLTAADTTDTQMGRWVESRVDLGGEQLISYPTQLADGTIVLYTGKVGEDSIEDYTRRTSTDGTNWTSEPAAFDVAMRWSRGSSLRRTVSRRLSPMTGRMPGWFCRHLTEPKPL